jgi:site-specific recombinase XerD
MRAWLTEQGYAPATQTCYERTLVRLSRWLQARRLAPTGLTPEVLTRFVRTGRGGRGGSGGYVPGLSTVLRYLRAVGACPAERQPGPAERVVAEYRRYLLTQRRLAPLTVAQRGEVAGRFVTRLVAGGDPTLSALTVVEVHGFVLGEARRLHRGAISPVLHATRSFLRFLFVTGVTATDLSGTLPAVTARPPATLPRAVDPATLTALVDSCDRSTPLGLRDYAILLLLSRLGLRASEVAAVRLDDIDWRAGELLVQAKGGGRERLPLPVDVGRALAAYLRSGRPATTTRAVFLRAHAPVQALSRNGVVFVPRDAARRGACQMACVREVRRVSGLQA